MYVVMKHILDIYGLWPSIGEMARDLDEAPSELLSRREDGDLPDPRHDNRILMRAIYMGKYLRQAHLTEMRRRRQMRPFADERREVIGEFFDAAGGLSLLAHKVGSTPNALRVAKNRARLPRKLKHELMTIAQQIDYPLDDELFEAL